MQAKNDLNEMSIQYVKGVGPRKAILFGNLGIRTIFDLFYHLPRRYEDRSVITRIKDVEIGNEYSIIGKILKINAFTAKTGTNIFDMLIEDGSGRLHVVWYNMPFMRKTFTLGQWVVFFGKVELFRQLQMAHPAYEFLPSDDKIIKPGESLEIGRIVPVYALTKDLAQRQMRTIVFSLIKGYINFFEEVIPTSVRARQKLVDIRFAMENIHFPHSQENLERAYKRVVFEEFFLLQIVMAMKKRETLKLGLTHSVNKEMRTNFESLFDFEFTKSQKKCMLEIEADMASASPMRRLLQGDVGSGKTIVALYALFIAGNNNYQAVLMAPTEILARQLYLNASKIMMPRGFNVQLLIGGISQKSKGKIISDIKEGCVDFIIGTHAVFHEKLEYKNLGLVIVDEQHKFGVEQINLLINKNARTDVLVMSATPIPRSLTMAMYGDMDISILDEKPAGREPVTTWWANEDKRWEIYEFIRNEIKKGHQAYIICSRVAGSEEENLTSVCGLKEHLEKEVFTDLPIALIHGKMKTVEKDKVMMDFKNGKYNVLISTTVIEVGVDVPNATIMLIENADRYGLAQLHQLRGRIGRGKSAAYCILMGQAMNSASEERLKTIASTDSGFDISEKDLDLRGPGEFLGKRQTGLPEIKFGDIVKDFDIMEVAREEAFNLVNDDPELKSENNLKIKKIITERFVQKNTVPHGE
ncbi:ATP-dependent DNA helicase RecG [Candidatus Omnitrophus magneticus]|uniref:ATP-dependent DNA helicase RecG n=1 Tax=Candidatus Omnitrophus magneticus TaxID=1609969 RepID=A0A0F0CS17_9BACT|nr:ATP-dependent DNA helicase RecG [Candidatus Omnitrophus magneticus]